MTTDELSGSEQDDDHILVGVEGLEPPTLSL